MSRVQVPPGPPIKNVDHSLPIGVFNFSDNTECYNNSVTKLFKKLDKYPTYVVGIVQALATATYIGLFALLVVNMQNADTYPIQVLGVIVSLLLLVFSSLVCGLLVLGYPAVLALRGKIKRAVMTVIWSVASLAMILFAVVLTLLV